MLMEAGESGEADKRIGYTVRIKMLVVYMRFKKVRWTTQIEMTPRDSRNLCSRWYRQACHAETRTVDSSAVRSIAMGVLVWSLF